MQNKFNNFVVAMNRVGRDIVQLRNGVGSRKGLKLLNYSGLGDLDVYKRDPPSDPWPTDKYERHLWGETGSRVLNYINAVICSSEVGLRFTK